MRAKSKDGHLTSVPLQGKCITDECQIGDWAASAIKNFTRTQIAFTYGGSITRGYVQGNITLDVFLASFPYGSDLLTTFQLQVSASCHLSLQQELILFLEQGKYLLQVLENSVSLSNDSSASVLTGAGRFLQVLISNNQRSVVPLPL